MALYKSVYCCYFFTFLITLVSIDPRGKNKKLKTNITGSIITIIKLSDEVSAFIAIPGAQYGCNGTN